jgi:hypothetical protein
MRNVLIVVLLAGAGFLAYKYLYKGGSTPDPDAAEQFMASCRQASAGVPQVEVYCACLAKSGVKSMMSLATRPSSRAAVATCQMQVGHVAPSARPAPQPSSGGHPTPTGRGRTADKLVDQVQKAARGHVP